jgi:putative ABC transport system ATP-binding protein
MQSEASITLLSIAGLRFSYDRRKSDGMWTLLVENFTVRAREVHIIVGNNMSGKSTFLNIVAGLQSVSHFQSIKLRGVEIHDIRELRKQSMILSNSDNMFPELSVWNNIQVALPRFSRARQTACMDECRHFLERSDVFDGKSLESPLYSLSTGGRVLVRLCRAYAAKRSLVVIDELTSYLDDQRSRFFLDRVLSLLSRETSVLIVSHNERDRAYIKSVSIKANIVCRMSTINRLNDVSTLTPMDNG